MAKSTKTKKTAAPPPSTKAARLQRTKTAVDQEKHKPRARKAGKVKLSKAKREQIQEALRAARTSRDIELKIEGFTGAMPKLVVPYLIAEARRKAPDEKTLMYSEGARQTLRVVGSQTLGELARDCAMMLNNKGTRMLQARDVYTTARLSRLLAGASCMDPLYDVQPTTAEHRVARMRLALKHSRAPAVAATSADAQ